MSRIVEGSRWVAKPTSSTRKKAEGVRSVQAIVRNEKGEPTWLVMAGDKSDRTIKPSSLLQHYEPEGERARAQQTQAAPIVVLDRIARVEAAVERLEMSLATLRKELGG